MGPSQVVSHELVPQSYPVSLLHWFQASLPSHSHECPKKNDCGGFWVHDDEFHGCTALSFLHC